MTHSYPPRVEHVFVQEAREKSAAIGINPAGFSLWPNPFQRRPGNSRRCATHGPCGISIRLKIFNFDFSTT
jgi:hypothetical protein